MGYDVAFAFRLSVVVLWASLSTVGCNAEEITEKATPNILVVLVDDLGWADIGVNGSPFYETPNIDQLARSGANFINFYAASPVCSPTRAALLTGKHPTRLGMTTYLPGFAARNPAFAESAKLRSPELPGQLGLEEETLAEVLKTLGYTTFFAGKWHLGSDGFLPQHQGFDVNIGGTERGNPGRDYYSPYENSQLEDGPDGEYLTDRLTDETIAFMESQAGSDQPFFALLSFYSVHTPIGPAPRLHSHYLEKRLKLAKDDRDVMITERHHPTRRSQDDAAYASMVSAVDYNVGRLIDYLDRAGLADSTILIFTSDNGGLATVSADSSSARKKRLPPTSNYPLRSGKGWLYEGGIRVPLIVRGPVPYSHEALSLPLTTTDLFPTIVELAGGDARTTSTSDGSSIFSLLEEPRDRPLIWDHPHYHASGSTPAVAIRLGRWKLIRFYEEDRTELYDLDADPCEENDLAAQRPSIVRQLNSEIADWYEAVGAGPPVRNLQ